MSSIFTKIINGEIPCYKIAENEDCLAFLDINPLTKGHTLVIPKKEVDYYFNLSDNDYTTLNLFAKKVAEAIKAATNCNRIGVTVIGTEVPHAHIHLIPFNHMSEMNFSNEKLKLTKDDFESIAKNISAKITL